MHVLSRARLVLTGLSRHYRKLFSIDEIEREPILQWMFGASLFYFFVTFNNWIYKPYGTTEYAEAGQAVCWPYFQDCYRFFFLQGPAHGWSQNIFYTALLAVLLVTVWCMWRKYWLGAHLLMSLLLIGKALAALVFVYFWGAPYHYYHIILTFVLLFIPHKEFFLKLCFVAFYFLAATTKFDETWILGTYFTSLQAGLPLFPDAITPLITNLVIFSQVVGCWFLLSRHWLWQRLALIYFFTFHLYSTIFVWYLYPSITLPVILILFGPLYRYTPIPFTRRAIAGWLVVLAVALFQVPPLVVSENRLLTLEANRFGMFMFEANHQCVMEVTTYLPQSTTPARDKTYEIPGGKECEGAFCLVRVTTRTGPDFVAKTARYEGDPAWHRCDPYAWWARLHRQCETQGASRVAFTFDHSVNGGPFYRMVDVPNICNLTYEPFRHNEWIKLPPEAPIMGYPVKNTYRF